MAGRLRRSPLTWIRPPSRSQQSVRRLFQAPILLFVVYGLLRQRAGSTPLVHAGAAVTNMFFYLSTTFLAELLPDLCGLSAVQPPTDRARAARCRMGRRRSRARPEPEKPAIASYPAK
jgi:hypothetical protein